MSRKRGRGEKGTLAGLCAPHQLVCWQHCAPISWWLYSGQRRESWGTIKGLSATWRGKELEGRSGTRENCRKLVAKGDGKEEEGEEPGSVSNLSRNKISFPLAWECSHEI